MSSSLPAPLPFEVRVGSLGLRVVYRTGPQRRQRLFKSNPPDVQRLQPVTYRDQASRCNAYVNTKSGLLCRAPGTSSTKASETGALLSSWAARSHWLAFAVACLGAPKLWETKTSGFLYHVLIFEASLKRHSPFGGPYGGDAELPFALATIDLVSGLG